MTNIYKTARNVQYDDYDDDDYRAYRARDEKYKSITNETINIKPNSILFKEILKDFGKDGRMKVIDGVAFLKRIVNVRNLYPTMNVVTNKDIAKIVNTSNYKAIFALFSRSSANIEHLLSDIETKSSQVLGFCSLVDACFRSVEKTKNMCNSNKLWYLIPTCFRYLSDALRNTNKNIANLSSLYLAVYSYLC